jgi:hypothetical protein
MRAVSLSICLAFAIGCGGSKTPTPDAKIADAPAGTPDAPAGTPDAPAGTRDAMLAACTGALYDPCTDPSQCTSGNCHNFTGMMFEVCTQSCGAGNPCPDQGGTPVTCNSKGICVPGGPNACTR